ncbi:MAG: VCBS repeat-containing protein [Bryobacteraceae bacterium]
MADASPYGIIRTTPNFAGQFTACLPKQSVLAPLPPPQGSGVSPGAPAQAQAFARLASGDYLQVQSTGSELDGTEAIDLAVFRADMTLVSQTTYAVSAVFGYQFTLADVNGDGNADLIALASAPSGPQAAFEVLLGNGDGTFQSPLETLVSGTDLNVRVATFAVADVNGDGKPDLVFGITTPQETGGNISSLAGNGDGTFGKQSFISSANVPGSIALADLNGDGKPDLVFSDLGSGEFPFVSVALGTGDGSFGTAATYSVAGGGSLAVGDVNGDGIPDITTGSSILFGDGKGAFPRRADYLTGAVGGIVLTDLDGDGPIDIVSGVNGNPSIFTGSTMSVLLGRGNGMFWGAPLRVVPGLSAGDNFVLSVAAADFNGDGFPDLALSEESGEITILQGSGAGSFTPVFQYQLANGLPGLPVAMVTADFNSDGKPDLAVAVEDYTLGSPNFAAVFLGKGDGTFQEPTAVTVPAGLNVASLAAGDFNGDGKPDLAVVVNTEDGGAADEVLIFLGNGDGSFKLSATYAAGPVAFAIVAGDFNGDGKLDLAIANQGTNGQQNGGISLLLGKGDGTFSALPPIPLSGSTDVSPYAVGPSSIAAADLNGDGKLDLVVTLSNGTTYPGGLAVLLGRGDGSFLAPVIYPVTAAGVVIGDLNGDGIPDLIVSTPMSTDAYGGAGYLLGNGDGTFAPEAPLAGGIGPLVTGDFNRDGKLDVAGADGLFGVVAFLNASPRLPPVRGPYRWLGGR